MQAQLNLSLSKNYYLRNPEETKLGRRIVESSIRLIDELGFENFTFKKLAEDISSTEASVYRYFENKHKLLIYLISWYWAWLEYRISYNTHNIASAQERLKIIIKQVSESDKYDSSFTHIREEMLYKIVIMESNKAYFTKQVEADNEEGLLSCYRSLCKTIAGTIEEVKPGFPYAMPLATTMIASAHQQIFFAEHVPAFSCKAFNGVNISRVSEYVEGLVMSILEII